MDIPISSPYHNTVMKVAEEAIKIALAKNYDNCDDVAFQTGDIFKWCYKDFSLTLLDYILKSPTIGGGTFSVTVGQENRCYFELKGYTDGDGSGWNIFIVTPLIIEVFQYQN